MAATVKTCELCEEDPATILCSECFKCYCEGCNEFVHKKGSKRDHKTEVIPEGVAVEAMCPIHNDALRRFCTDEVKLCCSSCVLENLHICHKVVKTTEIAQDNEAFSVAAIRKSFEDTLKSSDTLNKEVEEIVDSINKEAAAAREKVKEAIEKEHQKLSDEESRLMAEIESACNEAIDALLKNLRILNEISEYGKVLNEMATEICGGKGDKKRCSKLMELNIMCNIEKQRKEVEKLLTVDMWDLKIGWDENARKLSFSKHIFNGGMKIKNIVAKVVSWSEIEVSWEVGNEAKKRRDIDNRYTVEIRGDGEKDKWKEVRSRLVNTRYTVTGLKSDSVYEIRVKCFAAKGNLVGEWSDVVSGRTLKAPKT